jgi:hypothetical protein
MLIGGHRPRRRRRPGPGASSAGMQGVAALVIGTPRRATPEQLWRQGMAGMGETRGRSLLDRITGGGVTNIQEQLGRVELALKVSTAAAVVGMLLTAFAVLRRKS